MTPEKLEEMEAHAKSGHIAIRVRSSQVLELIAYVRQLQAENKQLQAENGRLEDELAELRRGLEALGEAWE